MLTGKTAGDGRGRVSGRSRPPIADPGATRVGLRIGISRVSPAGEARRFRDSRICASLPDWASQVAILQGFAQAQLPDHVLREDRLEDGLRWLAVEVGVPAPPTAPTPASPAGLDAIYDAEIEDGGARCLSAGLCRPWLRPLALVLRPPGWRGLR